MIIYLDFVFAHENDSTLLLSGKITLNNFPISSQELLEYFDETIFNAQRISAWVTEILTIIESNELLLILLVLWADRWLLLPSEGAGNSVLSLLLK